MTNPNDLPEVCECGHEETDHGPPYNVDLLLAERREREEREEARWPRVVTIEVHPDLETGIEDRDTADSESRPGHKWALIKTSSGWQHADLGCEGWQARGSCRHVKGRNMETTALVPTTNILALIDALEDDEIAEAIGKEVQRSWVYEFPQGGTTIRGLSSTGVEQAARELAKQGEAIRELDCKIEYEDENEARFVAQAGRYAISPEGASVLLDVAIRGKRQPKKIKLRTGAWQDDEHWYEKGITKAVRNAKLALLPESAKTLILAEAVKVGRVKQVENPRQTQRQVTPPQRPANVDADGVIEQEPERTLNSPTDLLNEIAKRHGNPAMQSARAILPVHFGTMDLLKLKDDQRTQFVAFLRFRLRTPEHKHEEAYTGTETPRMVCSLCGEPLAETEPAAPVQAQGI